MGFNIHDFLNNIFSVSNEYTHKKICILGIRLKIRIKDKQQIKESLDKEFIKYKHKHEKVINHLKEELKHRKLRVCFLVSETQKWNAQSIYDSMEKSNIFEPFVLVTKVKSTKFYNSFEYTFDWFKKVCKNVECGYDTKKNEYIDIKIFKPDIIFYQQPGNLSKNQDVKYASDFALPYHFSYAIGDAIQIINSHVFNFYIAMQKYFIFSKAEQSQYETELGYKNYNISVTGHPKLDIYRDYKEDEYQRKYVIYAPHHTFEKVSLHYATFEWSGKFMLEYAMAHPEFDWIFKPHPRFKEAAVTNNIMTEDEVEDYYSKWAKLGRYYNEGAYFDIFKNSKCLITDCDSFLVEYLPTRQPCIHMRNPKAIDYIKSSQVAMASYHDVWNKTELENMLNEILIQGKDYKKADRIKAIQELGLNDFCSGDRIIAEVKADCNINDY